MIHPEFKKFVNLIGHDITISGHATLPRCENPCRIETKQRIVAYLSGIPIAETHFEKIVNLPDSEDGVYYIVSRIVMDYVPFKREDVLPTRSG